MNKNVKNALIAGAAIVAVYLAYRWYQKRKNSPTATGFGITSGLGTNLNSINPITMASMNSSGLTYNGGAVNLNVVENITQPVMPSRSNRAPLVAPPRIPPPTIFRKPVPATAANVRSLPRSLNASPVTTSLAVKRKPVTAKPKKLKRKKP